MSAAVAATIAATITAPPRITTQRKVILADPQLAQNEWLDQALAGRPATSVVRVQSGAELAQALAADDVDLVVTAARLRSDSALQLLARLRSQGSEVPFIVYSSLREQLMRILVSDVKGTLLSSRVVDLPGLVETARGLMDRQGDA